MTGLPDHMTPEQWLAQVFSSNEARRGGVIKRQIADVERLVGRDRFLEEAAQRGFQVLQNGRHFVVFCNLHSIHRLQAPNGLSKARAERAARRVLTRFQNRV